MRLDRIFAACAPGIEPLLAAELSALGLEARAVPGGAEASGADAVAVACLGSRLADAVSARLYAGPAGGLDATLSALRQRFGQSAELLVRRRGGEVTVSLDAAGSPLYKRGWRARVGAAPLRETLAAAMLAFAGWEGETPLLDPMCGSGTLAIEAALRAARRAPGRARRFAFESWPDHDAARTAALRARLEAEERTPPAPIRASDRNGGAVRLATRNAAEAGVSSWVRVERADAGRLPAPGERTGPGLIIVNPPYGSRLDGDPADAWRALAALAAQLPGWRLCLLAPERGLERLLPERPEPRCVATRNGGMAVRILLYDS